MSFLLGLLALWDTLTIGDAKGRLESWRKFLGLFYFLLLSASPQETIFPLSMIITSSFHFFLHFQANLIASPWSNQP